jgi:hypothetical protein
MCYDPDVRERWKLGRDLSNVLLMIFIDAKEDDDKKMINLKNAQILMPKLISLQYSISARKIDLQ